ncbi:MAG: DNA-binding protein [Syntrophotaleaceae bacterium]
MARKGITFAQVAEVCKSLQEAGEPISVRTIQASTGGSMTTVLKHYRLWKEGEGHEPAAGLTISRRLQQALLAELRQTAAKAREGCTAQALLEVNGLRHRLAESERRIAILETALLESDRLRHAQEEELQQLRRHLAETEHLKSLAETRGGSQEQKPAPEKVAEGPTRSKKSKTDKQELPGQEPNLFDF